MKRLILATVISGMALGPVAAPAVAQTSTKAGILACDVSAGVGPDPRTETDFALHLHPGVRRRPRYLYRPHR